MPVIITEEKFEALKEERFNNQMSDFILPDFHNPYDKVKTGDSDARYIYGKQMLDIITEELSHARHYDRKGQGLL